MMRGIYNRTNLRHFNVHTVQLCFICLQCFDILVPFAVFSFTDLLSSAAGYRPVWKCVQFLRERAVTGRTRLLLHKHLVLVTFEVVRPRQEGPSLWSAVPVAVRKLVSLTEI